MAWTARLSDQACKQLARLPKIIQQRLGKAITELEGDPFQGNVLPLKGHLKGLFRKRIGNYRIIFRLNSEKEIVEIASVEHRAEKTYK